MVRITKEFAKQFLSNVPAEHPFYVCDGKVLKNLKELAAALKGMNDETYKYHANKEKNDFSNWVRNIITDEKLAKDLEKSRNRLSAAKKVATRIKLLRTK